MDGMTPPPNDDDGTGRPDLLPDAFQFSSSSCPREQASKLATAKKTGRRDEGENNEKETDVDAKRSEPLGPSDVKGMPLAAMAHDLPPHCEHIY